MHIGNNLNASLINQFAWAGNLQAQLTPNNMGVNGLQSMFSQFNNLASMMNWNATTSTQFGLMPDYANAGNLDVDKKAGVVKTPGGYEVAVKDGTVTIKGPSGKTTQLKAEPPNRSVTKSVTNTETRTQSTVERQLPRDPVVRESDGDVWRYAGTGSFNLPDGTKITIQEQGKDKDLHINQVDIYNGNKHVSVKSELTNAQWQTVNRETLSQQAGDWRTVNTNRRNTGRAIVRDDQQERMVTSQVREDQVAQQTFKTTFSDVTNDGFAHDLDSDDGQTFRIAGDGDDWTQDGREVISGAGKGKDNKELAYQLGDRLDAHWEGYRPLDVPWNIYATQMTQVSHPLFGSQYQVSTSHWDALAGEFTEAQRSPWMPVNAALNNYGGFNSVYAGPMGGAALYGAGFANGFNAGAQFGAMNQSVASMAALFGQMNDLSTDLSNSFLSQPHLG